MDSFLISSFSALWLGILTSVSPCPLATNIAAISFIGKRFNSPRMVTITGLVYTFGRMFTYMILSAIVIGSLLTIPGVSNFLQKYMNRILGPILIIVGMSLLELIKFSTTSINISDNMQKRVTSLGIIGAGLLGIIFALSFCPISAALFFGSLIPLAVQQQSVVVLPFLYGIGTALPVLVFAVLLSISSTLVSKVFSKLTQFELWARRITGSIFILVGIYYCLVYVFRVLT
jgi:cytochrome c biogenesis protein CcdA